MKNNLEKITEDLNNLEKMLEFLIKFNVSLKEEVQYETSKTFIEGELVAYNTILNQVKVIKANNK